MMTSLSFLHPKSLHFSACSFTSESFFTAQGKQKKCGGLINFKACSVYARKGLIQAVFSEDIRVLSKKP